MRLTLPSPTRALALLGATAALGLVASGCGSGHDGHSGAASTTTATATDAGAVDRAFVAQMIPHHELAVAMAAYTADRARHPQIKTLGTSIIRTQDAELTAMRAAAERLGVATAAASSGGTSMDHGGAAGHHSGSMTADARTLGLSMDAMGMSMDMDALRTARPFDRAFIDEMLPHHQGAIRMARAELAKGRDPELRRIATAIVSGQSAEIERMNEWREAWYGNASPKGGVPGA